MSFNINTVIMDMIDAVKGTVSDDAGDIGGYAKTILENEKTSMEELSQALFDGDIDEDEFSEEIEREKQVFEAELLTLQVMTKAMVQKAVNAAMDVFVNAVKVAI